MTALYNEIEPYAAAWLRNLSDAGHIAKGSVDARSIAELRPAYTEIGEALGLSYEHKGDPRARALADRHYSRQNPGHPMFTRPGFSQVLYLEGPKGGAVFVWWRPKWESGIKGTERKDKLRAIECTLFRNESGFLSSELIEEACAAVQTWKHATDTEWPDGLITGVSTEKTKRRRSKRARGGECYRRAGWVEFEKAIYPGATADLWLRATRLPPPCAPEWEGRVSVPSSKFDKPAVVIRPPASLKPFWRYYGGKWRAAPRYPAPEHATIVEPFAGAAGYSLRHSERNVVLVEKYAVVAEMWRYLIGVSREEVLRIPYVEHVDDLPAWVPAGARSLVGFTMNAATVTPCKALSSGRKQLRAMGRKFEGWSEAMRERVANQVDHIRHWKIIEGDYTSAPDIKATWFVDPPYQGRAGDYYVHPASEIDFAALGAWCRELRGQRIVCENEGATWLPFRPFAAIKSNQMSGRGGVSREAIWTGEEPAAAPTAASPQMRFAAFL